MRLLLILWRNKKMWSMDRGRAGKWTAMHIITDNGCVVLKAVRQSELRS